MDAKRFGAKVFAVLATIGAVISVALLLAKIAFLAYRHVGDVWVFLSLILSIGLAGCLFSFGVRAMRWSSGLPPPRTAKVKWERVYIGYWLLFSLFVIHFQPSPYLPVEESDKRSEYSWIWIAVLAAGLIITGMNSRFRQQNQSRDLSDDQ